ncbi:MAG: DUF1573 domain-containing protein [Pirellulaceae bacterium]
MKTRRRLNSLNLVMVKIMSVLLALSFPTIAIGEDAYKRINLEKEVEVADKPDEVQVGKLEAGEIYDVRVNVRNTTGKPFTPKKAVATCSCIVGIIPEQMIESGKSGSFLFRIRTSLGKPTLYQQVSIRGAGSKDEKGEALWKFNVRAEVVSPISVVATRPLPAEKPGSIRSVAVDLIAGFSHVDLSKSVVRSVSDGFQVKEQSNTKDKTTFVLQQSSDIDNSGWGCHVEVEYLDGKQDKRRSLRLEIPIRQDARFSVRPQVVFVAETKSPSDLELMLIGKTDAFAEGDLE